MDDRILAAGMVAPLQPVDVREFRRPDRAAGSAVLVTERSEVCGLTACALNLERTFRKLTAGDWKKWVGEAKFLSHQG